MNLIDTHAHLQFEKFDSDRDKVVKRNSKQLVAVINPGASLYTSKKGVELAQKIDNFYAAVGVHPHHVDQWKIDSIGTLENLLLKGKVVAVGEVGLDRHLYTGYPAPDIKAQFEILIPQIELAQKHKKPILFHCRKAYDDLYELLKTYKPLKGLVHCFMGDTATAKKFVDLGLLISFAGNLTYKQNPEMREAAKYLASDLIVIETDSPYLTPEPIRGTRNEPTNVSYVAKLIAELKNLPTAEVEKFTVNNSKQLFSI